MGIVAGALFVAAYLLCLAAVCTVRFLAVALDLPAPAYQTRKPVPAPFPRTSDREVHHYVLRCWDACYVGVLAGASVLQCAQA